MQLIFLLEQVLNGLLSGVYYLLIALGLSLIFSLGGIVNLAHGAFYALGAYLTVILSRQIGFAATFVAAPVLVGLLGVIIERLLFRRFYRADPILSLLLTFGLAMVAEQGLAHDLRRLAAALRDAGLPARAAVPRRLHLSEEPPRDAGGRRRSPSRSPGC